MDKMDMAPEEAEEPSSHSKEVLLEGKTEQTGLVEFMGQIHN